MKRDLKISRRDAGARGFTQGWGISRRGAGARGCAERVFNGGYLPVSGWLGVLVCLVLWFTGATAAEIFVKPGSQINTIQKALAVAKNGDVIRVGKGCYLLEDLVIEKSVTLIGDNYPVLDGQSKSNVLIIRAKNVTVRGFVIRNSGIANIKDKAGIRIERADNVHIINNKLENTCFGIYLSKVNGGMIIGNSIVGQNDAVHSGNGIHLWYSHNISIINNTVRAQRDGIYFEFATFCDIKGNLCENNFRYGLHFMFSHNDNYTFNTFRNNGSGVAVMYTKHIRMLNNTFEQNWGSSAFGLLLKDISQSYIGHNTFSKNTSGIYMEGTTDITMEKNSFFNNGLAVRMLANCEKDTFLRNNFMGNTFDFTTNGTENRNYLNGNYWDKYNGYDLNRDHFGDIPYRPVSLYSQLIERLPAAIFMLHSFMAELLDKAERAMPSMSYVNILDDHPSMHVNR